MKIPLARPVIPGRPHLHESSMFMVSHPSWCVLCALVASSYTGLTTLAQDIQVGAGSYRTVLPEGDSFRRVEALPSVASGYKGSVPTSDWCSSLVWPMHSPHSLPMFPHPLGVQAHAEGLGMGYTPVPVVASSFKDGKLFQRGTDYRFPYRESLRVGLLGLEADEAVLDRCSDWSVTALWEMNRDQLRATFSHGSPFVYFEKQSEKPAQIALSSAPVNRTDVPVQPLVFQWTEITAKHAGTQGEIQLAVNAGKNIGTGSRARLVYDFDGDGTTDRVETFGLFATDPIPTTYESYRSNRQKLDENLSHGEMKDFQGGSVRLEFWKCFGEGDVSLELSESSVKLPWGNSKPFFLGRQGKFSRQPVAGVTTLSDTATGQGAAKVFFRGEETLGLSINGVHFGLFAPAGAVWKGIEKDRTDLLTSNLAGKNYWSIAILPDNQPATVEAFRKVAFAFVTDTQVSFAYEPETSSVTTEFRVTTEIKEGESDETLMGLYRHQHLFLDSDQSLKPWTYAGPRGQMKVIQGTTFSTTHPFTGVLPSLPSAGNQHSELRTLLTADFEQIQQRSAPFERDDSYWNGKEFGKFSELIQIADQLDEINIRDSLLTHLKTRLEEWFDAKGKTFFFYDSRWQTLVGYPDSYGSADQLNDHHFHYSYFIKAAATLAQFDPDWTRDDQYGAMIDLLIRDCANYDRNDTRFPWMRNFDPYAGHSWASGHAGFASGNNQESSSESVHFATALILYGEATGRQEIRDLGIYWYSTEVEAIRQYWFDVDRQVFPGAYDHSCVGMVWGDGGAYGTWWTANPEEIHGINFLPIQGGSLYLGQSAEYMKLNFEDMTQSNRNFHQAGFEGDPNQFDRWKDILFETEALAQPEVALKRFKDERKIEPEFGETRTHTLQWLTALSVLGRVDSTVRANHATAVMFRKQQQRHYVMFNFGRQPIVVAFTDGEEFTVDPGWAHVVKN